MFLIDVLAGACQNCGILDIYVFISPLFHTSDEMTAICERLHYEAATFLFKNHRMVYLDNLWGLHGDVVQRKSREPCAGCKMDGEEGGRGGTTGTIQKRDG